MQIQLSSQMQLAVAEHCARQILGEVHSMHLRVSGEDRKRDAWGAIREVRSAVKSTLGLDRINFVALIKHSFRQLRDERGTEPRWQTYKAKVDAYRRSIEADAGAEGREALRTAVFGS